MTAVGLGLVAAGVVLVFAGVKGTDPRETIVDAFAMSPTQKAARSAVIGGAAGVVG